MSRISSSTNEQQTSGPFQPTQFQSRRYFSDRLRHLKIGSRDQLNVKCPFHDDRTASMSLNLRDGLWNCHVCNEGGGILDFERLLTRRPVAECWEAINATIGREDRSPQANVSYDYRDSEGNVLYQAVRINLPNGEKKFFQQRPDGKGGSIKNLSGVTPSSLQPASSDEGGRGADRRG